MRKKSIIYLPLVALATTALFTQTATAQKKLLLIKASSTKVSVNVDGELRKNAWNIEPKIKPDVYKTNAKRVTFITDLDSITFKVDPKKGEYNFVILLNGKDSALTQIKYEPSYLQKLQKAEQYNAADNRAIPTFTYQSPNDPTLVRIRQELKLDSIAGKGSELTQIFNLLHFVHNVMKHDGNKDNPALRNAIDLIAVCQKENRGVNCRMLATALNDCYLAMGIKSRYITCMPRETQFSDCHVINMVYSKEYGKWIWIDPTNDAYVMDEKGNLLGIEEVRERLIKGQPLILNADANWNHQERETKAGYLEKYMAKNLYRLQTPVSSEVDSETWKTGKEIAYVELLPLDGIEQTPQKQEYKDEKKGVKATYYKTNNPTLFWTKPE